MARHPIPPRESQEPRQGSARYAIPPDYPILASAEIITAADFWLAEDTALVARLFRPGMQYAWQEITNVPLPGPGGADHPHHTVMS